MKLKKTLVISLLLLMLLGVLLVDKSAKETDALVFWPGYWTMYHDLLVCVCPRTSDTNCNCGYTPFPTPYPNVTH